MNNLHRLFIAINLPERLRNKLAAYQNQWLSLPAKWARPQNLHIALSFLGNANDQELCDICASAADVAKRHDPFDITLSRICYGPLKKFPPRMVWAVGDKSADLKSLQMDLENMLHEFAGADSESGEGYEFLPHVTLARVHQAGILNLSREEIPVIDENFERTFLVESIDIMECELKRGGPNYIVLDTLKLGE